MIDWQADDLLPTSVLNYLGALKIHVQRTQFVLAIFNTASIAITVYFTSPVSTVHVSEWVPVLGGVHPWASIWGWLGTVAAIAAVYLVIDRVLVYPAEVSYNSHQASRRERNPGYDVTVDSNERIQRIEDELNITQTDGGHNNDTEQE